MIALRSSAACWIAAACVVALVLTLARSPSVTAPAPQLQLHEKVEAVRTSSDLARTFREEARGVLDDSLIELPRRDPGN